MARLKRRVRSHAMGIAADSAFMGLVIVMAACAVTSVDAADCERSFCPRVRHLPACARRPDVAPLVPQRAPPAAASALVRVRSVHESSERPSRRCISIEGIISPTRGSPSASSVPSRARGGVWPGPARSWSKKPMRSNSRPRMARGECLDILSRREDPGAPWHRNVLRSQR